jgi:hypothetical protein
VKGKASELKKKARDLGIKVSRKDTVEDLMAKIQAYEEAKETPGCYGVLYSAEDPACAEQCAMAKECKEKFEAAGASLSIQDFDAPIEDFGTAIEVEATATHVPEGEAVEPAPGDKLEVEAQPGAEIVAEAGDEVEVVSMVPEGYVPETAPPAEPVLKERSRRSAQAKPLVTWASTGALAEKYPAWKPRYDYRQLFAETGCPYKEGTRWAEAWKMFASGASTRRKLEEEIKKAFPHLKTNTVSILSSDVLGEAELAGIIVPGEGKSLRPDTEYKVKEAA